MRKDAEPVRVQTWDELERYMQGSAGSVGRILAALLGVPAERRDEFASLALHMIDNPYLNGEVVRLDAALRMAPR